MAIIPGTAGDDYLYGTSSSDQIIGAGGYHQRRGR